MLWAGLSSSVTQATKIQGLDKNNSGKLSKYEIFHPIHLYLISSICLFKRGLGIPSKMRYKQSAKGTKWLPKFPLF